MRREFVQMSTVLSELHRGDIKIEYFSFTPEELKSVQLSMLMGGGQYSFCHHLRSNYTYTRLLLGGSTWMSDTPLETFTNQEFINKANGSVLMFGLGMGYCLVPLLRDETIRRIVVVDKNAELIDTMRSIYIDPKLEIIQGDAFEIDLGTEKFDTIYFDIWRDISGDNYEDMKVLHRRFRKNYNTKNHERYINSWMRDICISEYNKMKRSRW